MKIILPILALVAVAAANPPHVLSYANVGSIPNSNYQFNYAVNDPSTGDNKAQWEVREGDVVRGAYSLVEPDGSIRIVEYTADPVRGFNAVVKKVGPNVHSISLPVIAPIVPVPRLAPIAIAKQVEPILPIAPIAPIASIVPIPYEKPYYGIKDDYVPIPIAPIGYDKPNYGSIKDGYGPTISQIETEPSYLKYLNAYSAPAAPWVTVRGKSYGPKGNIVRRWAIAPITKGERVTIKTKH